MKNQFINALMKLILQAGKNYLEIKGFYSAFYESIRFTTVSAQPKARVNPLPPCP